MKNGKPFLIGAAVLAALLLLAPQSLFAAGNIMNTAINFVKSQEGFSSTAYWDVSRYSWGYGTQAPGAGAVISEAAAAAELGEHLQQDYEYLKPLVATPLNANQWAALLSFSYNLGRGNADNLVNNINASNWDALKTQWMLYVNAGGSYNSGLAQRRENELQLFFS